MSNEAYLGLSLALSFILIVITAVYVYLTFRMLQANLEAVAATRSQLDAMLRPCILASPSTRPGQPVIRLRITNVGNGVARDLRLTLDKDFYRFATKGENHNLATQHAFSNPISYFPPKAELLFDLALSQQVFKPTEAEVGLCPARFGIRMDYAFGTTRISERSDIDLEIFHQTTVQSDQVVEVLNNIKVGVESIAERLASLNKVQAR